MFSLLVHCRSTSIFLKSFPAVCKFPSGALSFCCLATEGEKIDEVMSEGELKGDRKERKRRDGRWGSKEGGIISFSASFHKLFKFLFETFVLQIKSPQIICRFVSTTYTNK